jgi:hypothetical protein
MSHEAASPLNESPSDAAGDDSTRPGDEPATEPTDPSPSSDEASFASVETPAPTSSQAPRAAAAAYLDRFVQTLQWESQRSACHEIGNNVLQEYSAWYHEKKGIVDAKNNAEYWPSNCKVSVPLQPLKRAKEGMAFLALSAEADGVIKNCKIELGKL